MKKGGDPRQTHPENYAGARDWGRRKSLRMTQKPTELTNVTHFRS